MTDMTRDEAVEVLVAEAAQLRASLAPYSSPAYRANTERKIAALDLAIAALQAQGEPVGYVCPGNLSLLKEQTLVEAMIFRKPTGQAGVALYAHPPAAKPDAGDAWCAECGVKLETVRPGKHQHPTCSQQPDAVAGLVELLAKVPLPPNAITYDKGWDLLNELQALAVAAALGRGEGECNG